MHGVAPPARPLRCQVGRRGNTSAKVISIPQWIANGIGESVAECGRTFFKPRIRGRYGFKRDSKCSKVRVHTNRNAQRNGEQQAARMVDCGTVLLAGALNLQSGMALNGALPLKRGSEPPPPQ